MESSVSNTHVQTAAQNFRTHLPYPPPHPSHHRIFQMTGVDQNILGPSFLESKQKLYNIVLQAEFQAHQLV